MQTYVELADFKIRPKDPAPEASKEEALSAWLGLLVLDLRPSLPPAKGLGPSIAGVGSACSTTAADATLLLCVSPRDKASYLST